MATGNGPTRKCLCSPTNHPGSFRCCLHRSSGRWTVQSGDGSSGSSSGRESSSKITMKASTLKDFLMQIIKPSRSDTKRRRNFQPKPSRFCLMNSNPVSVS